MLVTRFAPSPTGYLHIGGARTALFCWLLARRQNGKMILRIEDTDAKRNTPTATQQVIDDLRWLGIDWDEGPDVGGPNGPYLQSQRRDIYNQYLKKLLDAGQAYYAFDTPEELQAMREAAQKEKRNFIYPRPAEFPTDAQADQARADGRPVVVRFCMPDTPIVVQDEVRGTVTFAATEFSDLIIQKSDGFPTYHFACVVDDELMGVTHIIRGQEHLMNTPGHMALQAALGFRTPTYAHMSVTVSEGGGKLSKRERAKTLLKGIKDAENPDLDAVAAAGSISRGELDDFIGKKSSPDQPNITAMADFLGVHLPEINVVDFRHSGYLPEALMNFVALLGWSPNSDQEIMPVGELIGAFDIGRLSKTNSLFDRKKLAAFNSEHMRMVALEKLLAHFQAYLQHMESPMAGTDAETLARLLKINEGARMFDQVVEKCAFLYTEDDAIEFDPKAVKKVLRKDGVAELLAATRAALAAVEPWNEAMLHDTIERLCQRHDVGMGKIAQPIRVAITGSTISPPIGDSLELLGKDATLKRIDRTLSFLQEQE